VWQPFGSGGTIGQEGSEVGTIIRDDEHLDGARITLGIHQQRHLPLRAACMAGWFIRGFSRSKPRLPVSLRQ
jgi:hypothetical protein